MDYYDRNKEHGFSLVLVPMLQRGNAYHFSLVLVPMLQRGNAYHIGSHTGAWEPGKN
ncbi:MAG: hypothetical protein U9R02_11825 [Thermodesulfobacteriota bacterium]|nr:hypothetical protein [Thermodesulfobacteriota bacterium]